jgi:hypothetical protein
VGLSLEVTQDTLVYVNFDSLGQDAEFQLFGTGIQDVYFTSSGTATISLAAGQGFNIAVEAVSDYSVEHGASVNDFITSQTDQGPFSFTISTTEIPEPSTFAVLLITMTVFGGNMALRRIRVRRS